MESLKQLLYFLMLSEPAQLVRLDSEGKVRARRQLAALHLGDMQGVHVPLLVTPQEVKQSLERAYSADFLHHKMGNAHRKLGCDYPCIRSHYLTNSPHTKVLALLALWPEEHIIMQEALDDLAVVL